MPAVAERRQLARSRQAVTTAQLRSSALISPPSISALRGRHSRHTARRGGSTRGCIALCRHAPHDVARPVGVALDNDPGAALGGVRTPIFCPPLQCLLGKLHRHAHARLAVPAHQLLLRTDTTPRARGARAAGLSARARAPALRASAHEPGPCWRGSAHAPPSTRSRTSSSFALRRRWERESHEQQPTNMHELEVTSREPFSWQAMGGRRWTSLRRRCARP